MSGRYNIHSRQPESGNLLTVEVTMRETSTELFIVSKYLNSNGKTVRIETDTIRK